MTRARLAALALLLSLLPTARAQERYDPLAWFEPASTFFGTWLLKLDVEGASPVACRLELLPLVDADQFMAHLDPDCAAQFPQLADVTGWTAYDNSFALVDERGEEQAHFILRGPTWIVGSPADGSNTAYLISQLIPNEVKALSGDYDIIGAGSTCTLRLLTANAVLTPGATEFAYDLRPQPGCEDTPALAEVAAWTTSDKAIVLLTADTQTLAVLRPTPGGAYTGDLEGSDITLSPSAAP